MEKTDLFMAERSTSARADRDRRADRLLGYRRRWQHEPGKTEKRERCQISKRTEQDLSRHCPRHGGAMGMKKEWTGDMIKDCLTCERDRCVFDELPDDDAALDLIGKAYSSKYQRDHHERNVARYAERQKAIARARKARGLSQAALAALIGISRSALSEWETGKERADWPRLLAVLPELKKEGDL